VIWTLKNQQSEGRVQVGWFWIEGQSTDEYTCKFQPFVDGWEKQWYIDHRWEPMYITAPHSPVVQAGGVVPNGFKEFLTRFQVGWDREDNADYLTSDDADKIIAHLLTLQAPGYSGEQMREASRRLKLMASEISEFGGDFREDSDEEGTCKAWAFALEEISTVLATITPEVKR